MTAPTNLSALNSDELRALQSAVAAEIAKRVLRERADAKKKIREIASAHQIDLKELVEVEPALMFRNPDNPTDTWNGKGRKPEWFKQYAASGKDTNDLRAS